MNDNGNEPSARVARPEPWALTAPVPTATAVGKADAVDGRRYVALQLEHAAGSTLVFLDPRHARELARELTDRALEVEAAGDITIAGPDALRDLPPLEDRDR